MFGIQEFVRHRTMPVEYQCFSYKKKVQSDEHSAQDSNFQGNG
jgi:hypothetical protein